MLTSAVYSVHSNDVSLLVALEKLLGDLLIQMDTECVY